MEAQTFAPPPAPTSLLRSAAVVIATYNRGPVLLDTIAHVLTNSYPVYEVVVVDQTPRYPSEVEARLRALEQRDRYRRLRLPVSSLPLARNVGIRETHGEIVIFCDDDVLVEPDFVERHVRCYDDPCVGAVAGRIVGADGKTTESGDASVGKLNPDGSCIANFDAVRPMEVDFGMGCNMSFRRSVLLAAGLFDERYTGGFFREEGDVFARVKRLGFKVIFEPATSLTHLWTPEGGCRKDRYLPRMRSTFRNETLFFLNCMRARHLPHFLYRTLRWIYATTRSNGYTTSEFLYLLSGIATGVSAHFFQKPDRLSVRLREQGSLRESG